jgi:NTP pyrophosphatase (non-canonical NTP hydrolase)
MSNNGLTKLVEECGELTTVAAKLIAYPEGAHPDNNGPLLERLEEEVADVLAAIAFVRSMHDVSHPRITERAARKLRVYKEWAGEAWEQRLRVLQARKRQQAARLRAIQDVQHGK